MRNISSKGRFRTKITQMQKSAQHKVERGAFTNLFDAELAQADLNRELNDEGVVVEDLLEDEFDNDDEEYDDVFDDFDVSDLRPSRDIDISDIHFTGDEDEDFDEMDEDIELDDDDVEDDLDEDDDLDDADLDEDDDLDDDEDECACDEDDCEMVDGECICEDCPEDDIEEVDDIDEDDEEELAEIMFISYPKTFRMLKSASAAPGITYANLPVEDQWTLLETAHISDTSLRDYNSGMKRVNKSYSPKRDVKVSVRMCAVLDSDGDICGDNSAIVCRNQRTGSTYGLCGEHKSIAKSNRNLVVKDFRGGSKEDELNIKSRRSSRHSFEADDEVPNTRKERKLEKAVKNRKRKGNKSSRNSGRTMIRKSSADEVDFSGQDGILSGDINSPPKYLKPGSFSNVGAIFM